MCDINVLSDYDVFTFFIYLFVYLSAAAGVTIAAEPQFVIISDDDIKKMKVVQLRQKLKARGLGIRGLKNELKETLEKAMVNKIPMANKASEKEAPQHVFGNKVFWKTLAPLEEPIKYPRVGTQFHQPTSDDVPVAEKRNYSQTFDRAPFIGVSKVDKIDIFKKMKIDRATGS